MPSWDRCGRSRFPEGLRRFWPTGGRPAAGGGRLHFQAGRPTMSRLEVGPGLLGVSLSPAAKETAEICHGEAGDELNEAPARAQDQVAGVCQTIGIDAGPGLSITGHRHLDIDVALGVLLSYCQLHRQVQWLRPSESCTPGTWFLLWGWASCLDPVQVVQLSLPPRCGSWRTWAGITGASGVAFSPRASAGGDGRVSPGMGPVPLAMMYHWKVYLSTWVS